MKWPAASPNPNPIHPARVERERRHRSRANRVREDRGIRVTGFARLIDRAEGVSHVGVITDERVSESNRGAV